VDRYLTEVAHVRITDVTRTALHTRSVPGSVTARQPTEQTFWVSSTYGSGSQQLTWPMRKGRWSMVVMNADATSGITATATAAVHLMYVGSIAMAALIGGTLALLGSIAAGLVARRGRGVMGCAGREGTPAFPLRLDAECDETPSRWLWAVKGLLILPHLVVLVFLWTAFIGLTVAAGTMILFTGRYPRTLFDFAVGVLRWTWRVGHYSYLTLGTDRYPPFTLTATASAASLEIGYPERLSRGLVLIKWLLVIPHLAVVAFFLGTTRAFGLLSSSPNGVPFTTGLIGLLVVIVAGHVVLQGRYPRGLFDLLLGLNRWVFRTIAYLALMTDVYPPFRLDLGRTTPESTMPAPDTTMEANAAGLVSTSH